MALFWSTGHYKLPKYWWCYLWPATTLLIAIISSLAIMWKSSFVAKAILFAIAARLVIFFSYFAVFIAENKSVTNVPTSKIHRIHCNHNIDRNLICQDVISCNLRLWCEIRKLRSLRAYICSFFKIIKALSSKRYRQKHRQIIVCKSI